MMRPSSAIFLVTVIIATTTITDYLLSGLLAPSQVARANLAQANLAQALLASPNDALTTMMNPHPKHGYELSAGYILKDETSRQSPVASMVQLSFNSGPSPALACIAISIQILTMHGHSDVYGVYGVYLGIYVSPTKDKHRGMVFL